MRHPHFSALGYQEIVSIHAPRAGCDLTCVSWCQRYGAFQFTHPVRGATLWTAPPPVNMMVSIHAPRAGCDPSPTSRQSSIRRFNSRTPCGVRPGVSRVSEVSSEFQFTHPVRGATYLCRVTNYIAMFQFTHPVRGATPDGFSPNGALYVSIHAPRAGCDYTRLGLRPASRVSIHAPRAGCDIRRR